MIGELYCRCSAEATVTADRLEMIELGRIRLFTHHRTTAVAVIRLCSLYRLHTLHGL